MSEFDYLYKPIAPNGQTRGMSFLADAMEAVMERRRRMQELQMKEAGDTARKQMELDQQAAHNMALEEQARQQEERHRIEGERLDARENRRLGIDQDKQQAGYAQQGLYSLMQPPQPLGPNNPPVGVPQGGNDLDNLMNSALGRAPETRTGPQSAPAGPPMNPFQAAQQRAQAQQPAPQPAPQPQPQLSPEADFAASLPFNGEPPQPEPVQMPTSIVDEQPQAPGPGPMLPQQPVDMPMAMRIAADRKAVADEVLSAFSPINPAAAKATAAAVQSGLPRDKAADFFNQTVGMDIRKMKRQGGGGKPPTDVQLATAARGDMAALRQDVNDWQKDSDYQTVHNQARALNEAKALLTSKNALNETAARFNIGRKIAGPGSFTEGEQKNIIGSVSGRYGTYEATVQKFIDGSMGESDRRVFLEAVTKQLEYNTKTLGPQLEQNFRDRFMTDGSGYEGMQKNVINQYNRLFSPFQIEKMSTDGSSGAVLGMGNSKPGKQPTASKQPVNLETSAARARELLAKRKRQ